MAMTPEPASSWRWCAETRRPACSFCVNHPATTEIYTLSLHDALPICGRQLLERVAMLLPLIEGDQVGVALVALRNCALAIEGRLRARREHLLHRDVADLLRALGQQIGRAHV